MDLDYDTLNYLEVKFHILGEDSNSFLKERFIHDLSQIKCLTDVPVAEQINTALQNYIDVMKEKIDRGEY